MSVVKPLAVPVRLAGRRTRSTYYVATIERFGSAASVAAAGRRGQTIGTTEALGMSPPGTAIICSGGSPAC